MLLWRQLSSPLILVLIASGAVALALGEVADGAVVLAVVVANQRDRFVQEWRAGRAIQALAALVPEEATVVRDGRRTRLPAAGCRARGHRRAAPRRKRPRRRAAGDGRVLEVDESPLTGESLPGRQGRGAGRAGPPWSPTGVSWSTAARW